MDLKKLILPAILGLIAYQMFSSDKSSRSVMIGANPRRKHRKSYGKRKHHGRRSRRRRH